MQREALLFFAKYIEKELGIVYSEANFYQLQNRLEEIIKVLGFNTLTDFYASARLNMTSSAKQLLLDSATNNETSFYRDTKLFKEVSQKLIPMLLDKSKSQKIRIWNAACSYGQEPYSVAMALKEVSSAPNVEILATDIAVKVLERAEKGRYTQLEVQRGLPASQLVKYFTKDAEDFWILSEAVRRLVKFERFNLHDPMDKFGKFDVIFCRNVLIYQAVENKKKIIQRLSERLSPGGFLIMGAGESLIGLSERFTPYALGEAVIYQVKPTEAAKLAS